MVSTFLSISSFELKKDELSLFSGEIRENLLPLGTPNDSATTEGEGVVIMRSCEQ